MPSYAILLLIQFQFVGTILVMLTKAYQCLGNVRIRSHSSQEIFENSQQRYGGEEANQLWCHLFRYFFQGFFFLFLLRWDRWVIQLFQFWFCESFTCDANQWEGTRITFWNRPRQNPLPPPNGMAYLGNTQLLGHYITH